MNYLLMRICEGLGRKHLRQLGDMRRNTIAVLAMTVLGTLGVRANEVVPPDPLDSYNVVWDSPSENALGSMPLGNGDIGVNAWVEPSGDLVFYVSKTDAWDENHRLCKVGRVRVKFDPALETAPRFRQELKLRDGVIEIGAGVSGQPLTIRLWVDANEPVIRVEADSEVPVKCRAHVELWRLQERPFTKDTDSCSGRTLEKHPSKPVVLPDTVATDTGDRVVWYHRNLRSTFPISLEQQQLLDLKDKFADPLLHHTFGASLSGDGMKSAGERALESERAERHHLLCVTVLAEQTSTAEQWLENIHALEQKTKKTQAATSRAATAQWWKGFWNRSWVFVGNPSNSGAFEVTRGYVLQRFMLAGSGRGGSPIKFNGSIFTVEPNPGEREDIDGGDGNIPTGSPDMRRWGGHYWFQNTRLCYWPMLASGDFEMMTPWFRYFQRALPLSKERTKAKYGFEETAQFPEVTMLWGFSQFMLYGWGNKLSEDANGYTRYYWNGNLELIAVMLDRYAFTLDEAFARETLVPLAAPLLAFYDQYWKERDANGNIRFTPSQSLETFWDAVNPMPEIAGLHFILPRMLALPQSLTTAEQRARWTRLMNELPPVPVRAVYGAHELKKHWSMKDDSSVAREPRAKLNGEELLVAAIEMDRHHNIENPELYCIFPYRLYGVGKDGLELARRTYEFRVRRLNYGWCQDSIQAALLGLGDQAYRQLLQRAARRNKQHRFPAMWGPNSDWTPDQDHGNNLLTTLQYMLLQTDGGKIRVLPAWPKDLDVSFKLHGVGNTVVECVYRGGTVEKLEVTPKHEQVVLPEFAQRQELRAGDGLQAPVKVAPADQAPEAAALK